MLSQALPLFACSGPASHIPKRSMRLPCAKPPTAAQSSHHATQNLPELTTKSGGLIKRYTNQVQTSTSHTAIEYQQVHELESSRARVYVQLQLISRAELSTLYCGSFACPRGNLGGGQFERSQRGSQRWPERLRPITVRGTSTAPYPDHLSPEALPNFDLDPLIPSVRRDVSGEKHRPPTKPAVRFHPRDPPMAEVK